MGLIGGGLCGGLAAPLIIIFVLIVIYRANFTNVWRDKRYWNRRTFEGKYGKIPMPLCPGALSGIEQGINSLESDVQSGISSATQSVASGAQMVASGAQTMSQDIASTVQGGAMPVQGTPSASIQNAAPATTASMN
jgi:hypothetical protein